MKNELKIESSINQPVFITGANILNTNGSDHLHWKTKGPEGSGQFTLRARDRMFALYGDSLYMLDGRAGNMRGFEIEAAKDPDIVPGVVSRRQRLQKGNQPIGRWTLISEGVVNG